MDGARFSIKSLEVRLKVQRLCCAQTSMTTCWGRPCNIHARSNSNLLNLPQLDLSSLAERFTKEEVLIIIRALPPNKALSSDGFTVHFLQSA
jgi:hypothetical protein